jgi:solute carrier family 25 carnitine/acylcarnitine transporter 20/29
LLRTGLQTQQTKLYDGPLDCAVKLYKQGGTGGIFKGQVATMWRDGVGYGCYFLAYEALVQRHLVKHAIKREELSPLWAVGYGAAAGYALWFR